MSLRTEFAELPLDPEEESFAMFCTPRLQVQDYTKVLEHPPVSDPMLGAHLAPK